MLLGKTFKVIETIGRGTLCVVYRCEDLELHGEVAVKAPAPGVQHQTGLAEFLRRDFENALRVRHRNVIRPGRLVEFEGSYIYSMELAENGALARQMAEGTGLLSVPQSLNIVRQLLQGLEAIHEAGMIHRNMKPESILIFGDGTVKIADFHRALPRPLDDHAGAQPSRDASPATMLDTPDQRTDIYAVGIVAYQLLTGKRPFGESGPKPERRATPLPPSQLREECTPSIDDIVLKALQRDRRARYQSASEALEDLDHCPGL